MMMRTGIRLLLAGIFIIGGWGALSNPGGRSKKEKIAHGNAEKILKLAPVQGNEKRRGE